MKLLGIIDSLNKIYLAPIDAGNITEIKDVVTYVDGILVSNQGVFSVVTYSTASALIFGFKFSLSRARYIVMERSNQKIYNFYKHSDGKFYEYEVTMSQL